MQAKAISTHLQQSHKAVFFAAGILFAALWASASTATKIGLTAGQPLVIAVVRFGLAAAILLLLAHVIFKQRLPLRQEWKPLAIYGLLNITVYLGLYVVAMQTVTAGIGALATASNPVFIGALSVAFLKKPLTLPVILALFVCTIGVLLAAWPLLGTAAVTASGLTILLASMLSYSAAAIYFSSRQWNGLSLLAINGWQTALGGLFLLPVAAFFYKASANQYNSTFWLSVSWLAVPVSIGAVLLWLWLLQKNAVQAGLWLFLCPPFGFALAAWLVKDPLSFYTLAGVLLVMVGLLLSKLNRRKNEVFFDR
ncbi:EamA family transporter [Flavisolibacter sp. BT320]|nr:EamA family transporter [Flavisolibacter longurius]